MLRLKLACLCPVLTTTLAKANQSKEEARMAYRDSAPLCWTGMAREVGPFPNCSASPECGAASLGRRSLVLSPVCLSLLCDLS